MAMLSLCGCAVRPADMVGTWRFKDVKITGKANPFTEMDRQTLNGQTIVLKADQHYTQSYPPMEGTWAIDNDRLVFTTQTINGQPKVKTIAAKIGDGGHTITLGQDIAAAIYEKQ